MKDTDDAAQAKLAAIKKYIPVGDTPEAALLKMAKLGAVIDAWKAGLRTDPSPPSSVGPASRSSSASFPAPSCP